MKQIGSMQYNVDLCKNVFVTEAETIYECKPFLNIYEYLVARNWLTPT